jgi:TPR repeat protein
MYKEGRGVPQNYSEAYFWYYLARLNGYEDAQAGLDEIEGKGFLSRSKLSDDEIERARRRAMQVYEEQQNR